MILSLSSSNTQVFLKTRFVPFCFHPLASILIHSKVNQSYGGPTNTWEFLLPPTLPETLHGSQPGLPLPLVPWGSASVTLHPFPDINYSLSCVPFPSYLCYRGKKASVLNSVLVHNNSEIAIIYCVLLWKNWLMGI